MLWSSTELPKAGERFLIPGGLISYQDIEYHKRGFKSGTNEGILYVSK